MAEELRLILLGGLRITRNGGPVTGFVSNKVQALLSYLAVTGRSHFRPALAGLLWGEMPEANALMNLRQALANLRRLVRPHLLITRQAVEFNRDSPYWLDVEEFEKLVNWETGRLVDWSRDRATNLPTLHEAVELYQGDFLEGFYVRDAPAFEEWVLVQRERLRTLALQALHVLVAHHASWRENSLALQYTTRLLALAPWREEAHRHKMLLLARSGQRSAALSQYETCRRILVEELGVEPSAETTALYERIRTAGAVRRRALPPQPTPFVGREEELAEIGRHLTDPDCRLLTLTGPGGIGKTRLALQAAAENGVYFLHDVCFVPLAPLRSAEFLVPAIADALEFSFHGRENPRVQLLDYLREKEMLLVLDGFEHLLRRPDGSAGSPRRPVEGKGADLVVDILRNAPELKFLVTSRERLDLRWEWLFEVKGLSVPESVRSAGFEDYSAVQLFSRIARRRRPRFSLDEVKSSVVHICQLVEGMPLGIELATAWVQEFSCGEIARGIERNLGFLTTSLRDVPSRHRSVRAAFDHSWNLLSEEGQRVFRELSVFRGGFRQEAAQQVAGASSSLLAALEDKSLLRREAAGRYGMHELLRQYAAEHLQAAGEGTFLCRRHLNYFVALAERAEPALKGPEQKAWLERLEADHDNLRAALEWSTGGEEAEAGLRLAGALGRFWEVRGYLTEGYRWMEKALARAKDGTTPALVRAKALLQVGRLAQRLCEYEQAVALFEEGLALFRELGDKQGVAHALSRLGSVALHQGNYSRATAAHEESLALKRELGDKWGIATSLGTLALANWLQGDYGRARALYNESLTLYRELGDKQNIGISLNNLGGIMLEQGDYEQAAVFFEEGLALFQELGSRQGIGWSLGNLGRVARYQGDYERAAALLEKCLALFRELGDKRAVALSLARLGSVAAARSKYERAEMLYREGLALLREVGEKRDIAECLEGMAGMALRLGSGQACGQGRAGRAARLLGAAEALREAIGAPLPSADRAGYERLVATVRVRLGEGTFEQAWGQGRVMPLEQAIEYALGKGPATAAGDRGE
ncbi:MAG: tetratricopeptide repeat protein [Anaerolineae bacterium]|nr:tetratricopeptide repeat protein [Anaerolineae bacterium]